VAETEDPSTVVRLEDDPTEQAGADDDGALDNLNILPVLMRKAPEWVSRQAKLVVSNAKDDNESREEYMKRYAEQLLLLAGIVKDLGYPAQGAKAPHIALMTKALLGLWARVWDQVVPAKGDVVKGRPLGAKDLRRAQRVERHMNWQLRYRIPEWASSHAVSILNWLMPGSTFRQYRWDPILHTHVVEHLPIDDVIVAYTEMDLHPLMKNVGRITIVMRLWRWEVEGYQKENFFSNVEAIYPKEGDEESGSTSDGAGITSTRPSDDDSPVRRAADKVQGVERPTKHEKEGRREYYAQHTRLRFPSNLGIPGLDGESKPVTFIVDRETQKPVQLVIREKPDPIDQARFDEELKAANIAAQNATRPPVPGEPTMGEPPVPGATDVAPPIEVEPPKIVEPRPVRMQTVHRIIHYRLFPNPNGFYGIGIGSLLASSNELANALAAEYLLSAKFYNMFCGFLARDTKQKEGDIQMSMGKFLRTDLEAEVLDKGIKVMEGRPPADGLMNIVEKLEENAEVAVNADVLSGERGASNETAKGMMIRNSNAMALISVITRLYLEPMKYEVKLIAEGNSVHLDEVEYFPFTQDIPGKPGEQEIIRENIGRSDYVEDVHLEFTADARMISKPERIQEAKDSITLIASIPQLAQNVMLMDFAVRQYWIMAEVPQYISAMGPPPAPPPPPTPEAQEIENAGFFNEKDHPVLPDDNHALHMHKIEELRLSPLFEKMSSTGKQMLDRHDRAHAGALYQQLQAFQEETGVPIHAMAGSGGGPGMGGGPDSGEVPPPMGGQEGGSNEAPPNNGPPGGPQ